MPENSAFRIHRYGGPEVMTLDEVASTEPGPTQCLVRIEAAGANPIDWKIREGFLHAVYPLTFPAVLGSEFAGVVIEVGDRVSRFAVGDRVMAMQGGGGGSYADRIAIDEDRLSMIPQDLSYVEAAALPVASLTGWKVLRAAGDVYPGMTVLIHGASGAVGGFAVQFAKAAGAKVFATASAAHHDYLLGLGTDVAIDYRAQRFEDIVGKVDLVIDTVGGETLDRSWAVLAADGAVVSIADPAGIKLRAPANARAFWHSTAPDPDRLQHIASDVAKGRLRSTIAEVFAKQGLPDAIERTRSSHAPGKIVIDFAQ